MQIVIDIPEDLKTLYDEQNDFMGDHIIGDHIRQNYEV